MKKALITIGITAVTAFVIVTAVKDYKNGDGFFMSSAEYWGYSAKAIPVEEIVDEAEKTLKTAQFESEASDEQTASEEEVSNEAREVVENDLSETEELEDAETVETETRADLHDKNEQTVGIDGYDPATAENKWLPYRVGGHNLDREIGDFLLGELRARDLEWWMPYALAQMFQESRLDPMAQNKNGLDKGILQYRVTYWDWTRGDIFDWKAQIRLYVEQTARRLASGCSIWETISRHNTSDYGTYNQEYVDQVLRWIEPE